MTKEEANRILGIRGTSAEELREGMRVRLVRGCPDGNGCRDYGLWIAGRVPVGSVGTVVRKRVFHESHPNNYTMYSVEFDGIEPKEGYRFGISGCVVTDDFEVVREDE
jgi:hypothetical protein